MSAVSVTDVIMTFQETRAVDGVSLDVEEGEFVTLLGPSGCGKTTLLKLISGFLQPTSGEIEIGGKAMNRVPPEERDTAMCFQSYALFPHLSVAENIAFGLRQKRAPTTERDARLRAITAQVDLGDHIGKLPNQLSGGQQQRVALGRALAVRPYVILFDEPLSNLDAKLREQVRYEIRKIQREFGLTAIYVTHDQAEALAMSDRIIIMNRGRIEQAGRPEDIYYHPRTRFVADFVGSANVLEARVAGQAADGRWVAETPIGRLLVEARPKPETSAICWRPESAVIGEGENGVQAVVDHRAFQGAFTDYLVRTDGPIQRLQLPRAPFAEGEKLRFRIPPSDIVFLEADA